MKILIAFAFTLLSTQLYAVCRLDPQDGRQRSPAELKKYRCQQNLRCLENVVRDFRPGLLDELIQLAHYGQRNNCGDDMERTIIITSNLALESQICHQGLFSRTSRTPVTFEVSLSVDGPGACRNPQQTMRDLLERCRREHGSCTEELYEVNGGECVMQVHGLGSRNVCNSIIACGEKAQRVPYIDTQKILHRLNLIEGEHSCDTYYHGGPQINQNEGSKPDTRQNTQEWFPRGSQGNRR